MKSSLVGVKLPYITLKEIIAQLLCVNYGLCGIAFMSIYPFITLVCFTRVASPCFDWYPGDGSDLYRERADGLLRLSAPSLR